MAVFVGSEVVFDIKQSYFVLEKGFLGLSEFTNDLFTMFVSSAVLKKKKKNFF